MDEATRYMGDVYGKETAIKVHISTGYVARREYAGW